MAYLDALLETENLFDDDNASVVLDVSFELSAGHVFSCDHWHVGKGG